MFSLRNVLMLCCNSLISSLYRIIANVSSIPSIGFELILSQNYKNVKLYSLTQQYYILSQFTHIHKDTTSILSSQFTRLYITTTYYYHTHTHTSFPLYPHNSLHTHTLKKACVYFCNISFLQHVTYANLTTVTYVILTIVTYTTLKQLT